MKSRPEDSITPDFSSNNNNNDPQILQEEQTVDEGIDKDKLANSNVIEIINKNEASTISSVEIGKSYMYVHFKDDAPAYIKGNRIAHFINRHENELDEILLNTVKEQFQNRFENLDNDEPRLTQEDVNQIYNKVYYILIKAKKNAFSEGKPLHIVIGEDHYCQNSLLHELIILDIVKNLGLKTICLEMSPEEKEKCSKGDISNTTHSTLNLDYLYLYSLSRKLNLVAIDNEESRKRTILLLKGQQLIEGKQFDETEYGELADLYGAERDKSMAVKIINSTLKEETLQSDLRLTVIGAGHLRGIVEQEAISHVYYTLPINCTGDDTFAGTFYDKSAYNTQSKLFATSNPNVIRLRSERDCTYYSNTELYSMVLRAGLLFQKNQFALLKNELTTVKNNIQHTITKLQNKVEKVLGQNLLKVLNSITLEKTDSEVKRIELRAALEDTLIVLENKNLSESGLYKEILNSKVTLSEMPTLNVQEYKNLRKSISRK